MALTLKHSVVFGSAECVRENQSVEDEVRTHPKSKLSVACVGAYNCLEFWLFAGLKIEGRGERDRAEAGWQIHRCLILANPSNMIICQFFTDLMVIRHGFLYIYVPLKGFRLPQVYS